jgi:hypothetical protein
VRAGTLIAGLLCVAVTVLAGGPATSAADDALGGPVELADDGAEGDIGLRGDDAVDALEAADATDVVADTAGLEPDELVEELLADDSMFVTTEGLVGYEELIREGASAPTSALLTVPAGVNVLNLSSRPDVQRVIYLDFNGHTTSDPIWGTQNSAPFDLDGTPGPFSATEQSWIYEIWQRVAEDYRPFNVNVTTLDPTEEGLRRSPGGDTAYGQRMVITPSNFVGPGTLGIALLNVFDDAADRSAFVFTDQPTSPKIIGEAVSHEAGHTLGLTHDGVRTSEYYDGHGGWAPIMGRSIAASTPVTQWSRGEYSCASNWQDDTAQLASYVGVRPDDVNATAPTLPVIVPNAVLATAGEIGAYDAGDAFVTPLVPPGPLVVTLQPPAGTASWSNLYATLTVRDQAGVVVATAAPNAPSGWTTRAVLTSVGDSYTIEVTPSGFQTADTGFTAYGSMGAYELRVSTAGGVTPTAPAATVSPPPMPGTACITPITPARLLDTRTGAGGFLRLPAGTQVELQVGGRGGIPLSATAAALNIVSVDSSSPGYVTAYPCSVDRPTTSNLNYAAGQILANATIAKLSSRGTVCLWALSETDIVVDATAWVGPGGTSRLTPVGPDRKADTRIGFGGVRLPAGGTMQLGFQAGLTAVAMNVVAVDPSTAGFLTAYPCGNTRPGTATVNYVAGEARPNNTIVAVGAANSVCIYSTAATDIVVDVTGFFGTSGGLKYQPAGPARLLDTRTSSGSIMPAETARSYSVVSNDLGTSQPGAAFVNVTGVDHLTSGFVTTYDCGTRPFTASVNQQIGEVNGNGAIVPVNSGATSCVWSLVAGNIVVDLNGWWVR